MLYNIRLKTGLFEVKLYYINFMRLFYQESQEIWRHKEHAVMQRKPRRQVINFQVISAELRIYLLSFYR